LAFFLFLLILVAVTSPAIMQRPCFNSQIAGCSNITLLIRMLRHHIIDRMLKHHNIDRMLKHHIIDPDAQTSHY